jgi:hypothetical protein
MHVEQMNLLNRIWRVMHLPGEQSAPVLDKEQVPFEKEMLQRRGLGSSEVFPQLIADLMRCSSARTTRVIANHVARARHLHACGMIGQPPPGACSEYRDTRIRVEGEEVHARLVAVENLRAHIRFKKVECERLGTPPRPDPLHRKRHDTDVGNSVMEVEGELRRHKASKDFDRWRPVQKQ